MSMKINQRKTFIPVVPVVDGQGKSLGYLDYGSASYIDSFRGMRILTNYLVEGQYEGHPELISYKFYGTVDYWWVLCFVNEIIDPISDIKAGTLLRIPELTAIEAALTTASTTSFVGQTVVIP